MSNTFDQAQELISRLNSTEDYLTNFLKIHAKQIKELTGLPIWDRENEENIYSTPAGRRMILQLYVDRYSSNMGYLKPPVFK